MYFILFFNTFYFFMDLPGLKIVFKLINVEDILSFSNITTLCYFLVDIAGFRFYNLVSEPYPHQAVDGSYARVT